MKYARIADGRASDVTELDPAEAFHPDLAAQFEPVPEHVENGASLIDGEWINPPPAPPPPEPVPAPPRLGEAELSEIDTTWSE